MWSFWLKNQKHAKNAPLVAEQGRRNAVNVGWLAIGALILRPWPPNKGAEMRPNFHCSGPFSATISAVPKRRSRAPFWSQQSLTQFGAEQGADLTWWFEKILCNFYGISSNGQSKIYARRDIWINNNAHKKIQTHQYKNKSYASDVSVCNYISSKQHKHKRFTFGACPLEVLRA